MKSLFLLCIAGALLLSTVFARASPEAGRDLLAADVALFPGEIDVVAAAENGEGTLLRTKRQVHATEFVNGRKQPVRRKQDNRNRIRPNKYRG